MNVFIVFSYLDFIEFQKHFSKGRFCISRNIYSSVCCNFFMNFCNSRRWEDFFISFLFKFYPMRSYVTEMSVMHYKSQLCQFFLFWHLKSYSGRKLDFSNLVFIKFSFSIFDYRHKKSSIFIKLTQLLTHCKFQLAIKIVPKKGWIFFLNLVQSFWQHLTSFLFHLTSIHCLMMN